MNFFGSKQKKKPKTPMIPFSEFSASREKRGAPERKNARTYLLIPIFLWAAFFLSLGYFLFFSEETMIRDISFSGIETISGSELQNVLDQDTRGKYFHMFLKNNFFFLPRTDLIRDMRNISPKIRNVAIVKSFPSGLAVNIEERPTVIIWRSSNGEFLLNEDGSVEDHPNLEGVVEMPFTFFLYDEEGRETSRGDRVIEGDMPLFIGEFARKFESRFGKPIAREIRMPLRFSGELSFHVEGGFDLLIDSHLEIDTILTIFQAAMDRGIAPADRDRLARVDLRTENRIYYTLKEQ